MKILCKTLFDCTRTGVTGHFRPAQVPFVDQAEQTINNQEDWNRARNQQRNWETIMQIASLRAQIMSTSKTRKVDDTWEFSFEVETVGVYSSNGDPEDLDGLLAECEGIPMVVGLNETVSESTLIPGKNIWFDAINIEP
jgi:hypothetical protein